MSLGGTGGGVSAKLLSPASVVGREGTLEVNDVVLERGGCPAEKDRRRRSP